MRRRGHGKGERSGLGLRRGHGGGLHRMDGEEQEKKRKRVEPSDAWRGRITPTSPWPWRRKDAEQQNPTVSTPRHL